MTRRIPLPWVGMCIVIASAASGCGGGSDASGGGGAGGAAPADGGDAASLPGNTISGSITGTSFNTVASSYWIGHPSAGGAPTQVYLLDQQVPCQAISAPGWDKTLLDTAQVLEMDLTGTAPKTYQIGVDADANYVRGAYNPSADGGTVTLASLTPSKNATGSFDIKFAADAVTGTFDAAFCATGVEP